MFINISDIFFGFQTMLLSQIIAQFFFVYQFFMCMTKNPFIDHSVKPFMRACFISATHILQKQLKSI